MPKIDKRPSQRVLKHRQAHSKNRRIRPAMTPMTIPAMAPPLRPCLVVVTVPVRIAPPVPTAVWYGTVVVIDPVEVTVMTVPLVPLTGTIAVCVFVVIV